MKIDRDSWWWQRGRAVFIIGSALLFTGVAASPLHDATWQEIQAREPEINPQDLGDNLGQGVVLGVLGGFRTILADFLWINGYTYWEKRDRPNTEAMLYMSTALDPGSSFFWDDASNKIGLDMPSWRVQDELKDKKVSFDSARVKAIYREQAESAIKLLDHGLQFNPGNIRLLLDKANLYGDFHLNDPRKAAEQYRLAVEQPDCPYFVYRIYAESLAKIGQELEGYKFLRNYYEHEPASMPIEERASNWVRLRSMEDELKLPADQRLPDSAAPPGWQPGQGDDGV